MARTSSYSGMSDLEREIELEMDDELDNRDAGGEDLELEDVDRDAVDEWELEEETRSDGEPGGEEEAGLEEDAEEVSAPPFDGGDRDEEHVERILEIASRQFESELEVDQALNEALDGMAREYLFGSILKKARRFGSKLAKNKAVRALVKKGLKVASGHFPALKAALRLAKGDLQGSLLNLGKQALGAAVPGGPATLGALRALGIAESADPYANRETWENYVQLSREAFEHLADNVTPTADQPLEASRLAANAYQHGMRRAQARAHGASSGRRDALRGHRRGTVIRHNIQPGQTVVITGAAKMIVKGV